MGLFQAIVRTAVNVAVLPAKVVADVVLMPKDISTGDAIGHRTADHLDDLKDEASTND